jgi:hypothetical protein
MQHWERQLAWLSKTLLTHPDSWKVVFAHHPLFATGKWGAAPPSMPVARVAAVLAQHNVHLYLAGHDHLLQHMVLNSGMLQVIGGGGGGALDMDPFLNSAQSASHAEVLHTAVRQPGFGAVMIAGGQLCTTTVSLFGEQFTSCVSKNTSSCGRECVKTTHVQSEVVAALSTIAWARAQFWRKEGLKIKVLECVGFDGWDLYDELPWSYELPTRNCVKASLKRTAGSALRWDVPVSWLGASSSGIIGWLLKDEALSFVCGVPTDYASWQKNCSSSTFVSCSARDIDKCAKCSGSDWSTVLDMQSGCKKFHRYGTTRQFQNHNELMFHQDGAQAIAGIFYYNSSFRSGRNNYERAPEFEALVQADNTLVRALEHQAVLRVLYNISVPVLQLRLPRKVLDGRKKNFLYRGNALRRERKKNDWLLLPPRQIVSEK